MCVSAHTHTYILILIYINTFSVFFVPMSPDVSYAFESRQRPTPLLATF